MAHTRRSVLKAAALAGTALFLPSGMLDASEEPAGPLGADARPIGTPTYRLTRSMLAGQVGSDFAAQSSAGSELALRLVEVEDLPSATAANLVGSDVAFAARFRDSSGTLLSQGTYTLDHGSLGRLWMFLVPVGAPSADGQTYEAIFNNSVPRPRMHLRRDRSPARKLQLKTAS
jgi:hypothetical protein